MNWIILVISMIACLVGSVVKKHSGDKFVNKAVMFPFYNMVISVVSAICLLALSGGFKASLFTVLLGIGFGIITAVQYVFCLKAYEVGPFSYTSVIVSLSTIIPALSGYFIWGEDISALQIVGIVLMIICFICSVDFSEGGSKASVRWLVYAMITFVTTGLIGVMQKFHQSSAFKDELDGFLVIAFFISAVFSAFMMILKLRSADESERRALKTDITVIAVILMVIGGACAAANNKMNLYLSGVMNTAVFFPVVNGGGLVLSTIASIVLFRETFTVKKWTGIIVGIISVVLLCI